jgi:hypothetical protein
MSPESPGSMGLGAPRPPGQGWPAESPAVPDAPGLPDALDEPDEPDPDWPDDWPDDDQPRGPGLSPPPDRAGAGGPRGRPRPLAVAAVAVAALAAGAGVALAVSGGVSSVPASTTPSRPPSAGAPSFAPGGNSGGGQVPGGGGGGGAVEQMFVGGKVLAVSGTSITIGGQGQSVTAAVTGSTRVTGRVSSIAGVKAGDLVTAQITQSGGRATVTAIQDPAEPPSGGSLP